jgi:hypothetical protein
VAEAGKQHNLNLLIYARNAFVHTLHITAAVSTILIVVTGLLVALKFKTKANPV